ncbi:MAG: hypothetical protein HY998_01385 [candidate division NC10 bacterium]|nr:hypothetical protein [candidate division NC10 bacterium]
MPCQRSSSLIPSGSGEGNRKVGPGILHSRNPADPINQSIHHVRIADRVFNFEAKESITVPEELERFYYFDCSSFELALLGFPDELF